MEVSDKFSNDYIESRLDDFGFRLNGDEGKLLLVELMVKRSAGFYVSHTEQEFLDSMDVMTKSSKPNKSGFMFLKSMLYKPSNHTSEFAILSGIYRK